MAPALTDNAGVAAERLSNASGRYEPIARIAFDDGWQSLDELPPFKTSVQVDATRKIITRNDSPDISFDRSINPYRGCEHGCVYCFARPTHAYLGLSPGLDFESKLFMKPDAPALLERELAAPGYSPRTIAIGTNTDPYQPIEKQYQIMRRHPGGAGARRPSGRHRDEVGAGDARHRHPVADGEAQSRQGRDLGDDARWQSLRARMEPRASTPAKRLEALRQLSDAGIPTAAMIAPVIPAINDADIERILDAVALAGVQERGLRACCGCRWKCATCSRNG